MKIDQILNLSMEQIFRELKSSADGLSSTEAEKRIKEYGLNEIKRKNNFTAIRILFHQAQNSLFYILFIAGILSYFLGSLNEVYIISGVLIINVSLGFYEEYKSEKVAEKLQKLLFRKVVVKRMGNNILENEASLVPGDVVMLREGDIVPADIRLLSAENLYVNESQLTGESVSINKIVITARTPKESLLFAGSVIEKGEGAGVVFATGSKTELGKIADLSSSTRKTTQYEKNLNTFSSLLIKIMLLSILIIFVAKLIITRDFSSFYSVALFMVALSVAVVPEALPVIATVTLASGALKLARAHVVVKSLSATEDLGNVTVLCTDKTGTLTENMMVVTKVTSEDKILFKKIALVEAKYSEKIKGTGNSFAPAILEYLSADEIPAHFELVKEIPFDPGSRRSRVIISNNGKHYLVSIGSVETLLNLSGSNDKKKYLGEIKQDGSNGLRHLGYAYKEIEFNQNTDILKEENNLSLLGFFTFADPLRKDAANTIKLAEKLGVQIKILSGDSPEVTWYVGSSVGLINKNDKVLTGEDIDKLNDTELEKVAIQNSIFARLNPEQKYRIIRLLKKNNVVAYQGDGINDAPSLKLADVAIAVNTATDIARENADIILLKKDLGVIINGLKYGRIIFVNINKYIRHTMIGNFSNFFALAIIFLLSTSLPLTPIQLLLTSLLTDLPLIAIATDNVPHDEILKPSHYEIRSLIKNSAILGLVTTFFIIIFYVLVNLTNKDSVQTLVFLFITLIGLVIIFSARTKERFFKTAAPSFLLLWSIVLTSLITLLFIYVPNTARLFLFQRLSLASVSLVLFITVFYLLILDDVKVWLYKLESIRS